MARENEGEEILAEWAEIEYALNRTNGSLAMLAPESEEALLLRLEVDRLIDQWASLRKRYQRLIVTARREHRPAPPQWPDPAN